MQRQKPSSLVAEAADRIILRKRMNVLQIGHLNARQTSDSCDKAHGANSLFNLNSSFNAGFINTHGDWWARGRGHCTAGTAVSVGNVPASAH